MRFVSVFLYVSIAFIAVTLLSFGVASVELEQIPTSHPTMFFVAPSVPDDNGEEGVVAVTRSPTMSPIPTTSGSPSAGTGSSYKDEITEENQTAVNTSSYMFYTFLGLFVIVAGGYYLKRCVQLLFILLTENCYLLYLMFLTEKALYGRRVSAGGPAVSARAHSRPRRRRRFLLESQH